MFCTDPRRLLTALLSVTLMIGFSVSGYALVIDGYTAATNDRFANAPDFIAADYNLSGIAIAPNSSWLTMIAANAYLTSDHFKPAVGSTITFYANNDPNGPTVMRVVTSNRLRFDNSDLTIGTLDKPLPEGYAVYTYATEVFGALQRTWNNYPYNGPTLLHIGLSPESYSTTLRTALGQNKLSRRHTNRSIENPSANGPAIEADKDAAGTADHVAYETGPVTGDSGGPLMFRFTDSNGDPALRVVGIAWYAYSGSLVGTGFTPVGHYASAIADFINTHGMGFVPAAPQALTAEPVDVNTIALSWQDLSAIESTYELERTAAGEANWSLVATLDANSTHFSDTGLSADTAFDYRIRALNANGSSEYSALATTSTPAVETFSAWQIDSGLNALDEADAGPAGDPDGDGIPNLLEYALGGNPLVPNSATLPQIALESPYMRFTFQRLRSDIDYRVLASDDLVTWSVIAENPGLVGTWVTVDDTVPITDAKRRFLRLQVVLP